VAVLTTPVLEIEYTDEGAGAPVVLVHGSPDGTRFRDDATVRDGTAYALAQDVLDLADGLTLDWFALVGHDWGARTAFTLAAVAPQRLGCISGLALGYQPRGSFRMPGAFLEARLFWYHWLMYAGAAAITADPVGFAREQWDTWSPTGCYSEQDFIATSESFRNPDSCDPPATSEGLEDYFDDYRRVVIRGAGHFPHREAPDAVLREVITHLAAYGVR
jgi:pimeloyl-ACP methyl ester carboxylesterase